MTSKENNKTPKEQGFRMPAEYDRHRGTILIWPERPGSWTYGAAEAEIAFTAVIKAITRAETVFLAVNDRTKAKAEKKLGEEITAGKVVLLDYETDDAWARDIGPTCIVKKTRDGVKGEVRGIDWKFNAWGGEYNGLYAKWDKDDGFAKFACDALGIKRVDGKHFVCEGGAIHSDGDGTLLVTEECLLSPGRNPAYSREEIESTLKEMLGADKVLWLPYGIAGDETDGHVDNVCAFSAPSELIMAWTEDTDSPDYDRLRVNLKYLESVTDAKGRKLKVRKLLLPKNPVVITEHDAGGYVYEEGEDRREIGERLAASYVNFYITNGGIVLPVFGDEHDECAKMVLKEAFPSREILPIEARAIIVGGGNVHCITQQVPDIE